jgi:NADH:ubiquinone oxidoreductase subunit 5 (subunit L)/multisubunit Na+/H+ antiporter MnhA subunit
MNLDITMAPFILIFILVPFIGFVLTLVIPERKEYALSSVAIYTTGLQFFMALIFSIYWLYQGRPLLNLEETHLYEDKNYVFFIDFFLDKVTIIYLLTGSFVTLLITRYSRYYMHLEPGYKRFFNTILFFYLGYNWTIFSGNFETLFVGWEILGISSFLLIAFYRERYLPVRNAVKVFTIYRIGDIGILAAMWSSHHLLHENITFIKLMESDTIDQILANHHGAAIFIGLALLIGAAAKSAQFPFSSWLPRAMEGPTPSSAIFYGSLSVHFGVFLLLRTYTIWENEWIVKAAIILVGLVTAIVATLIANVQATIKTQIAYASISQIGIMFMEVALGWHTLALIHFSGNAFLRTYQLLVSPSIVSQHIRDQFYFFKEHTIKKKSKAIERIYHTLYMLSLNEWYMDYFMNKKVFHPLKVAGQQLNFLNLKNILLYFIPLYSLGLIFYFTQEKLPAGFVEFVPEVIAFSGLLMVLKSFSERKSLRLSWILILLNHYCVALAVSFNEPFSIGHDFMYLSGVTVAGIVGFWGLSIIRKREPNFSNLNQYYGHVAKYPGLSFLIFVCALGMMAFPITPSFIGEDILFSHIHEDQYILGFFAAFSFIMGGVAAIRIYARIFLGNYVHPTTSHPRRTA